MRGIVYSYTAEIIQLTFQIDSINSSLEKSSYLGFGEETCPQLPAVLTPTGPTCPSIMSLGPGSAGMGKPKIAERPDSCQKACKNYDFPLCIHVNIK